MLRGGARRRLASPASAVVSIVLVVRRRAARSPSAAHDVGVDRRGRRRRQGRRPRPRSQTRRARSRRRLHGRPPSRTSKLHVHPRQSDHESPFASYLAHRGAAAGVRTDAAARPTAAAPAARSRPRRRAGAAHAAGRAPAPRGRRAPAHGRRRCRAPARRRPARPSRAPRRDRAPAATAKADTASLSAGRAATSSSSRAARTTGVDFSLEDADLAELVTRHRHSITGKRFIFGGKVRNIKATVYSPQKVTVAEAYQALPLDPRDQRAHRRSRTAASSRSSRRRGVATQTTPIYGAGQPVPDRGSLRHAPLSPRAHRRADEVADVLGKFKTQGRRHHRLRARATCSSSPTPARTSGA